MYSTDQIRKYVEQMYQLLPRSKAWGRIFQTPESLYVKVADNYPDIDSPYSGNPSLAPVNKNTTVLGRLLSIFGVQVMLADETIYRLQKEMIAPLSEDNLEEWEDIYKVEDNSGTIAQRQARLQTIIDDRQEPRSISYIDDRATANGATIIIQNMVDTNFAMTGGDINNFEGNEWFPWSGQCGAGECGAVTCGNAGWGGLTRITIVSLGNYGTDEELIRDLQPQIHAGTMVEWVVQDTGDIIMTTSASQLYTQTTDAVNTITQG